MRKWVKYQICFFTLLLLLTVACGKDSEQSEADDDDDSAPLCDEGEKKCSSDALALLECKDGKWAIADECMVNYGKLCEGKKCVEPWRYGSPVFDPCEDDEHATEMTLAEKAEKYDRLARNLHIHPEHKRIAHVTLAEGYTEDNATYENVIDWDTGENDGLWTGLYIASQAFRYAVTHDEDALDNLRLMMEGMENGMRITGVSGLFTREYITPNIVGMSCPSNPSAYVPSPDKKDNRWVKVDTDGTIIIYDGVNSQWVRTEHKVPVEFAGYCWLDNVSKDEYSGHMLALGVTYLLVDDEGVRSKAAQLLEEVADHLISHDMATVDWDGRITEHGRYWPLALDDFPGFNAILSLSYIKMAAVASNRQDIADFYWNCLLQKNGPIDCIDQPGTPPQSFADWLTFIGLYVGHDGCKSNWNNFAMTFLGMFTLVWYEHDPAMRWIYADAFENQMFTHNDNYRDMRKQHNAAWSMMASSMKNVGPGSTGQDIWAVNDAICALRQFPKSKSMPSIDTGEDMFPTDYDCESRFEGSYLTFDPVPVYLRCPGTFTWWSNPYSHWHCTENPRHIKHPADYLLPYWMGRYFGYIDESW